MERMSVAASLDEQTREERNSINRRVVQKLRLV
jgi:hypothetical protein